MLEQFPVWLLCVLVIFVVAASVRVGSMIARRTMVGKTKDEIAAEGAGGIVGAILGLLAFMLAFAFGMAADRRDARKQLLLDEVNSIGTTFLRTDLIPEPQRGASRNLLQQYVNVRLEAAEHPEQKATLLGEALDLQRSLWMHAKSLADAELKNPDITSLYVDSLNETFDLQTSRLTVSGYRIPTTVWATFGALMVLSALGVGYNFGLHSAAPQWLLTGMLSVSLATVLFLIFDLDRGNQGWLKVDQQPMYKLREQMGGG